MMVTTLNNRFSVSMKQTYWKMPSRTFIAREEKSMSGFRKLQESQADSLIRV